MKLYRFTASTTQKAISVAHDSLGANALVYSTRKIADGIEVLAGLPLDLDEEDNHFEDTIVKKSVAIKKAVPNRVKIESTVLDQKSLEKLKDQVQAMNENLQVLSENITLVHQLLMDELFNKKAKWGSIFKKLGKIKLRTGLYGYKAIFKK